MSNNRRDYRKSSFIDGIVLEMKIKEQRKQKIENTPTTKEQSHSRFLAEMGRQAYFIEYLYGIKPIEQDYSSLEGYEYAAKKLTKEEMIETITFKKGYNYAEAMAKSGVIPEKYKEDTKKHR